MNIWWRNTVIKCYENKLYNEIDYKWLDVHVVKHMLDSTGNTFACVNQKTIDLINIRIIVKEHKRSVFLKLERQIKQFI